MKRRKIVLWLIAIALGLASLVVLLVRASRWRPRSVTIEGAVIRRDPDPRRELPIADAVVTASDGMSTSTTRSDESGFFKLVFHEKVWPPEQVTLSVQHPEYHPFSLQFQLSLRSNLRKLYIARLAPIKPQLTLMPGEQLSVVSDIRVRYTVNVDTQTNVGTEVKTFQVVNRGNVPCNRNYPCSPDGLWKASTGSVTLDAGVGNEFHNVRASCIAGPCPFTRIDSSGFIHGGRVITASALDWSDSATFLVEAEVFRDTVTSNVRESYPVIYGRALHFALPSSQEGVSIEADIDGAPMVFPLGDDLYINWATCSYRTSPENEKSTVYQCELKPGYRF